MSSIIAGSSSATCPISIYDSSGNLIDPTDAGNNVVPPTIVDIIGEGGTSLGPAPNFGLNAAPTVTQDLDSGGNPIPGAWRINFTGRAADGGVFQEGHHYRVLWEAQIAGQAFPGECCSCVIPAGQGPQLRSCC